MGDDNPFKNIRRIVRSAENGGIWKAYAEDGSHLLDLDINALHHLATVSDMNITAEIEGQEGFNNAFFVREGMVLVFDGLQVWEDQGTLEISPFDHHAIEVNQHGIKSKICQPLTVNVGSQGRVEFDGVELTRARLEELMKLEEKVKELEKRLTSLDGGRAG